jgi:S1-C subfamily serine protease
MTPDIEQIELYILNMLPEAEHAAIKNAIATNPALQKIESENIAFLRLIDHKSIKEFIRNQFAIIKSEQPNTLAKINDSLKFHVNKYWRTASVAASVALVASTFTFMIAKKGFDRRLNQDIQLLGNVKNDIGKVKNDIKRIEKKTNAISNQVYAVPEQPKGAGKLSGTGFALSNNGYVITNEHVVSAGTSVYVFTADNIGHKCEIVSVDKELDLAILKINEKEFLFGNTDLPYTFSANNGAMAQKVYTLGFPKSSIVYNEGYISSINGNEEDSNRYQMELPSSPGVSGSPDFDEKGNIIALINSKQGLSEGITYALKSKKIIKYLKTIDSIPMPSKSALSADTRANQIKRLQDFVFEVKVY